MLKEKNCEKEFGDKCEKKFKKWEKCDKWHPHKSGGFMGGGFYFLTFLGAAVYYCQQAPDFWWGVVGVLKALVWPAMLIYKIFTILNM